MTADAQEALSVKFAADVIETILRFKDNQKHNAVMAQQVFNPDDVKYSIPTHALKSFLQQCIAPLQIIIPISVGQYYHTGAHAASQVACLENIRESIEVWFRKQNPSELLATGATVNQTQHWSVELIAVDSLQTLNHFREIELELSKASGQCIELLNNKELDADEERFFQIGKEVAENYRLNFQRFKSKRQKGFNIRFRVNYTTLHWTQLKRHYHDVSFINMLNQVEALFKSGANLINSADSEPAVNPIDNNNNIPVAKLLSYEEFAKKKPLIQAMNAAKTEMQTVVVGFFTRTLMSAAIKLAREQEAREFMGLVQLCESADAHNSLSQCVSKISAFLRNGTLKLDQSTYAYHLMEQLSKIIDFNFAALLAQKNSDHITRDDFCNHFDAHFLPNKFSLNIW